MNQHTSGAFVGVCAVVVALCASGPARADYIDHFANRRDVGLYKVPSLGETRVLVIPVIVDDLPFAEGDEADFLAEVADFYADVDVDVGDADFDAFRFTSFYLQQSLGRFHPRVTVADAVHFPTCPPLGAYGDCEIPRGAGLPDGDFQGAIATLDDALDFINEILLCTSASGGPSRERRCTTGGNVDFTTLDQSGQQAGVADGFVDGVILISNAGFPGIALPIKALATDPVLSALIAPVPTFVVDGVTVAHVGIAGRTTRPGRETFVSVHEFGHLLGFADLYNESGSTTDLPYTVMGGWYYSTPASLLDPFSRLAIGWANVVEVSGPGTYTLASAGVSGQVLKIGDGDEFFLVEHRKKTTAYDGDLEVDSGVFVERVRLQKRPSPEPGNYLNTLQNCVNCTPFDPMLMVEEADGSYRLQKNRGRNDAGALLQAGDRIEPSDNTARRTVTNAIFSTNLLSGAPTGISITVSASDDDGATVEVDAPAVADPCAGLAEFCDCAALDGDGVCGDLDERFPAVAPPPASVEGCGGCGGGSVGAAGSLSSLLWLLRRTRRRRL